MMCVSASEECEPVCSLTMEGRGIWLFLVLRA